MEPIATSGSLDHVHAAQLLVQLHQQNATGSLKLERAPLQKDVYLKDGQILFAASNDPKDQLASILVEEGKLGPDQMTIAQARVSAGNPLAKILTELGYVSQRELADAARIKVEKILADLYGWKEGNYQFAEGSLPKGAIDLELSTVRLLFNSMRRIQDREWVLSQLGSLDAVLSTAGSFSGFIAGADPDPKVGAVLRSVDGTKSVKQIAATSSLGEFEVSKILAAGVVLGALDRAQTLPQTEIFRPPSAKAAPPDPNAIFDAAAAAEPPPPPKAPEPFARERAPAPRAQGPQGPQGPQSPQSPPSRYSDFVIDEPPASPRPSVSRTAPRTVARGGGSGSAGRSNRRAILTLVVVVILGVSALYYVYVYLPQSRRARTPLVAQATTTAVPTTALTTAPTTSIAPQSLTSSVVPVTTTVSARPGGTIPPTRPPPTGGSTLPTKARENLRNGDYAAAAAQFLDEIRANGKGKYSLAVGLNCDIGNVATAVKAAEGKADLFILPARVENRSCYRVCWGLYDSLEAAEEAMGTLPPSFQKQRPIPLSTARLLR